MVRQEAVRMYKLQVEAAARDTQKQLDMSARQVKQQEEALEKAARLKPEEVLGNAFSAFIRKGKKPKPSHTEIDYTKMLDITVKQPILENPFFGESPGAARGSSSTVQQEQRVKGKGKGKGRGKGNGRGGSSVPAAKGSGKPSPPKGRGRGKGQAKGGSKGKTKNPRPNSVDGAQDRPKRSGRGGASGKSKGNGRSRW